MSVRVGAVLMAVLLGLYLVFAVYYAFVLFGTGVPVAIAIGVALLVLPLLGAGFIAAEIAFGIRAERLARRLALAYDAAGDRRRGRWATRKAIRIERAA